jgi:monoamine oxidase
MGIGGIAAAGGIALARREATIPVDPTPPGSNVIVIGAGAAGIGAVEKLTAAGYQVEWIEARDRAGGRTFTKQLGAVPMDMGASWMHDGEANYLRSRAEAGPLKVSPTDFNRGVIQHDGELVPIDAAALMQDIEQAIIGSYLSHNVRSMLGFPTTQPAIDTYLAEVVNKHGAQGEFGKNLLTATMGQSLDEVSLIEFISGGGPDGDNGYDPLPTNDAMIEGGPYRLVTSFINETQPTFGEKVNRITRTGSGVRVHTDKRVIEGDAAIVTIPLAILKNNAIKFEPQMSHKQTAALGRLGTARELKACLEYPENAWDSQHHMIGQCDSPYFDFFVNLPAITGAPGIMALSAGHKMEAAEAETPANLAEALHQDVRTVFGEAIPEPLAHQVSNFSQDPLSMGCWTYSSLDALGNESHILQQPIGGRILLAGEGLSDRGGTFDGAWNDGQRAAQAIIGSA